MYSRKLTCLLFIVSAHLTFTNAQFGLGGLGGLVRGGLGGFGGGFNGGGSSAGFSNQNTNFNQNSASNFGVVEAFGNSGQNTNFQQSSNRGGN